ncbi:MAG: flagellar hook capping FlgD N-terminal domain-containing protein [Bryobacteraceae bacterium]
MTITSGTLAAQPRAAAYSPAAGTADAADAAAGPADAPTADAESDPLTSKETFLKLLVAQLQNQNPLDPTDPMGFVTQLAQFSALEQSLAMRQELEAIRSGIEHLGSTPVGNAGGSGGAG